MELSNSNTKKNAYISQKKPIYICRETETPQKFLIFHGTELSYISGNGNPENFLYFRK